MGNLRVLLWVALGLMIYLNVEQWSHDYAPATPTETSSAAHPSSTPALADRVPMHGSASTPAGSAAGSSTTAASTATTGATQAMPASAAQAPAPRVHIKTDVLDLSVSLEGGTIESAALPQWPLHKDAPNMPVVLENSDPTTRYLLETGLIGADDQPAPTQHARFESAQSDYTLEPGAGVLEVPLTWSDGHGLTVTKRLRLRRGWYAIDVVYDVRNGSDSVRRLASYAQILRRWEHASRSYFNVETYSFKGPAVYDGTKTRDLNVENESDSRYAQSVSNGWIAALQHHFVSAIVPPSGETNDFKLLVQDHEFLLSATGPYRTIAPGAAVELKETLFIGPKLQAQLAATGPQLERTVDYGRLWIIAQPLFRVLSWVEGLTGNWGWAIVIVTALIKLAFYPLSQASGRSMAKMRAVAPRMKQIQETYKDDREKLGRAMMELYKREKINPLTGCLPMVVQIPFFFSFYWVLLESVEMRQAPFLLWINDLSSRDPIFILPTLMGAAMFGQFKLNPPPPDPMQAKIMQFMPLVMTATMMWFPAGLVLYWLTNTVLSILQQWRINQVVQVEIAKHRA